MDLLRSCLSQFSHRLSSVDVRVPEYRVARHPRPTAHCIALHCVSSRLVCRNHSIPTSTRPQAYICVFHNFLDSADINMQDPKILADILTSLQRLENRFEDQTDRLASIELSVRSRATSPTPPSASRTLESYSVEEMAADYQASVSKLRSRFEFIDDDMDNQTREPNDTGDWQSISVYSSRPQSQVLLNGLPLPHPPPVPPKDERRNLHVNTSNFTNAPDKDQNQQDIQVPNVSPIYLIPPRFEILETPPPPLSVTTSYFHIRRPTRNFTNQNIPADDKTWKNWRHWIRHAPGYRLDAAKAAFRDSRLNCVKANIMEKGVRMRRGTKHTIKACLRVVPNFIAWAGKTMVTQQMKRLDLSV